MIRVLFIAILLGLSLLPARAFAADDDYATELISQARARDLGNSRYWTLLLHYRFHIFTGWRSEADGEAFFLAKDGKDDPVAELDADIRAFLAEPVEGETHAQCRFPERFHWLQQELQLDPARVPAVDCPEFDYWYSRLNPGSVKLIFAAAYLNNPASMYGHTFLRFDKKDAPPGSDLLSTIINFSAQIGNDPGVIYAAKGLWGGYNGYFQTIPYYMRVQKYSNLENRDLWEYDLNLTQQQIDSMARHLWELGGTHFDYWFFDENCSYHLLAVIEIARPDLHLREQYRTWAIPIDTVRSLLADKQLIGRISYRPSFYKQTLIARKHMSGEERKLTEQIAEEPGPDRFEGIGDLPSERQGLVLDTADLYLRYRMQRGDVDQDAAKKADREILSRRAAIDARSPSYEVPTPVRPDESHNSGRIAAGAGASRASIFEEILWRPALRDFLSPPKGFEPGSFLEMGSIRMRFTHDPGNFSANKNEFTIENYEIFKIFSLWPLDPWSFRLSWKASVGGSLPRETYCEEIHCLTGGANVGGGLAYRTGLWRNETFYVFGEAIAEGGAGFSKDYRVAPIASGGIIVDLADFWQVQAEGRYLYPIWGDRDPIKNERRDVWDIKVETAFYLSRNVELRGWARAGTVRDEVGGYLGWYY